MDMSLDEIIKQKKINSTNTNSGFKSFLTRKKTLVRKTRVIDARNKIIQKKRAKIRDARERLGTKDARLRIKQRSIDNSKVGIKVNNMLRRNDNPRSIRKNIPVGNLYGAPRGYIDYDNMEMLEEEYDPSNISLRRTVYNDIVSNFNMYGEKPLMKPWGNDLFEAYDIPSRSMEGPENMSIRRKIRNMSPEIIPHKSILRGNSPTYHTRFNPEKSHLSYEMRSRLERAPDPHVSMGIFANPSKSQVSILPSSYRIVVSNLHSSVSQSDIQELFEDIGELHEARLVKPGVAEVIFKNLKDAEKAVDTYHNRQLDGQPMKCLLVNPRASNKPTAPALKVSASSQLSGKTPLEIDIDALHKVLFRRK
ncbi:polymerase delta-interacting protein 3-like [Condylostylus longicornis]|uniref:polymerase delta-interacting protein 3-like n=1 Tax=Condylostylus longicornis TaxID=2530218 RepID=UPI00244DF5E3|nr:polymerase delta-interacting protein 3-like [Condylostylus longicornis]